jgi:DNA-binding MarR family transcriptional regulator
VIASLADRVVDARELSDRQQAVATLVERYYSVAREMPSAGWLARQLSISRQRAHAHIDALRRKGWISPDRRRRATPLTF